MTLTVQPMEPLETALHGPDTKVPEKVIRMDAVLKCEELSGFLEPACKAYPGMQCVRSPTWGDIQAEVDHLHDAGIFGERKDEMEQVVDVSKGWVVDKELQAAADKLVAPLESDGFPALAIEQIRKDALEIGQTVWRLVPGVGEIRLKLELMKDNCCLRWHQDYYVARAICTYNCKGTDYIHADHVDFWELEHCGNNDCVVKDKTPVCSAAVGDILFIKGKLFPTKVNGLVHKSPGYSYHASGEVKTRLCLKVDVSELP